jgi:hypothetical protein
MLGGGIGLAGGFSTSTCNGKIHKCSSANYIMCVNLKSLYVRKFIREENKISFIDIPVQYMHYITKAVTQLQFTVFNKMLRGTPGSFISQGTVIF